MLNGLRDDCRLLMTMDRVAGNAKTAIVEGGAEQKLVKNFLTFLYARDRNGMNMTFLQSRGQRDRPDLDSSIALMQV